MILQTWNDLHMAGYNYPIPQKCLYFPWTSIYDLAFTLKVCVSVSLTSSFFLLLGNDVFIALFCCRSNDLIIRFRQPRTVVQFHWWIFMSRRLCCFRKKKLCLWKCLFPSMWRYTFFAKEEMLLWYHFSPESLPKTWTGTNRGQIWIYDFSQNQQLCWSGFVFHWSQLGNSLSSWQCKVRMKW